MPRMLVYVLLRSIQSNVRARGRTIRLQAAYAITRSGRRMRGTCRSLKRTGKGAFRSACIRHRWKRHRNCEIVTAAIHKRIILFAKQFPRRMEEGKKMNSRTRFSLNPYAVYALLLLESQENQRENCGTEEALARGYALATFTPKKKL